MLKSQHFILLIALLVNGGTGASQSLSPALDGGTITPHPIAPVPDGGTHEAQPSPHSPDAGAVISLPGNAGAIHWPDEVHPVVVLDGPAVLAAHAALQSLLASFPKELSTSCSYSAKAMEVIVGKSEGLYFVRIDQHVDRCGWAAPGFIADPHWWEVYAVTPDGRVLARKPYSP
jgi:hypothetical protein